MKLNIFLLTCYRDTATKQHFVKAVKKNRLFSENTLENAFEDFLPEKKVSL